MNIFPVWFIVTIDYFIFKCVLYWCYIIICFFSFRKKLMSLSSINLLFSVASLSLVFLIDGLLLSWCPCRWSIIKFQFWRLGRGFLVVRTEHVMWIKYTSQVWILLGGLLMFKWRRIVGQVHYPPSFRTCTISPWGYLS